MKKTLFLLTVLVGLIATSCANPDAKPEDVIIPNALIHNSNVRLDTITPPNLPLQPHGTNPLEDTLTYYGYLDLAKCIDGERYCALIGLRDTVAPYSHSGDTVCIPTGNVYLLRNKQNKMFRYDDPLVGELCVGEQIYVRGVLTKEPIECGVLLYLRVCEIIKKEQVKQFYW